MNDGLSSVTDQAKLGTVADKVARGAAWAEAIAPQVGVDPALARRAAELTKADLQSRMVNEFPELQGIAGRYYAMQDAALDEQSHDDRNALANAIDEAWQPRFSSEDRALPPLGKVTAIAARPATPARGLPAGPQRNRHKDPITARGQAGTTEGR